MIDGGSLDLFACVCTCRCVDGTNGGVDIEKNPIHVGLFCKRYRVLLQKRQGSFDRTQRSFDGRGIGLF